MDDYMRQPHGWNLTNETREHSRLDASGEITCPTAPCSLSPTNPGKEKTNRWNQATRGQ
nr:hypothetical protein [Candidatus Sigynarchaeota archaeon]